MPGTRQEDFWSRSYFIIEKIRINLNMAKFMESANSEYEMTTTKRTANLAKAPAVTAGGAAAGVENPGGKGPSGDSDMAGGE